MNSKIMASLCRRVRSTFRSCYPEGKHSAAKTGQSQHTAFAMQLSRAIGPKKKTSIMCAAPKKTAIISYLKRHGIKYEHREWMVDIYIGAQREQFIEPLLACESEAYAYYGVGNNLKRKAKRKKKEPFNGYLWDFLKLLHFRAPCLLFVARIKPTDPRSKCRICELEKTLCNYAKIYSAVWQGCHLKVVLLPEGKKINKVRQIDKGLIRIGVGYNGSLSFEQVYANKH